jgi:RNA polymerase sigma-70 factor (ECF subfamily)
MSVARALLHPHEASDEELMRRLAAGQQEALGPLYARYAPLIYGLAARSLDRAAAEEIVQDVFLAVWRKAETFVPERGAFRPWVLQIAHFRVINELRHRARRPQTADDPEGDYLAAIPDGEPEPAEAVWRAERQAALRAALGDLPPTQRQALALAYFEGLTHEEVARALDVPLGTTKTRIRTGLRTLRSRLVPLVAALALVAGATTLGVRYVAEQVTLRQDERALALVTSSPTQAFRLTARAGTQTATHAVYRGQNGYAIAVLTFSNFPPAPSGATYAVWVRHGARWTSLGSIQPDATGSARLIAEDQALATLPDAVEVTLESSIGVAPSGPQIVTWQAGQ